MPTALIQALLQPSAYSHPVEHLRLLETHISWVILTGKYAYKIKKPVSLGFIDYSTLEKRRYYCEQEILLNQALASSIYQQVVPITQTADGYYFNGTGTPIEYAVQMLEFSQKYLLSHALTTQDLSVYIIPQIAKKLAGFHLNAKQSCQDTVFGLPETIQHFVIQNFDQARALLKQFSMDTLHFLQPLQQLEAYCTDEFSKKSSVLLKRKENHFVRSCHGDLRLENITLINDEPVIFDCIEFNEELRWIDVMSDISFLIMDFHERKYSKYAWQFLNTYLTHTGDYTGLAVLPYYFAYRAMVRAKIQLFNIQTTNSTATQQAYLACFRDYVQLAITYLKRDLPYLIIMHGFSGSGKSTLAERLAETLGVIVLHSDVERKRLFNLQPEDDSHKANEHIYQPDITFRTYRQLKNLAVQIMQAGYPVIIDATCLQQWQRQWFMDLAVPFVIVDCFADKENLVERLRQADKSTRFFSEAGLDVLEQQLISAEPLTYIEAERTVRVNTDEDFSLDDVLRRIKMFLL